MHLGLLMAFLFTHCICPATVELLRQAQLSPNCNCALHLVTYHGSLLETAPALLQVQI